MNQHKYINSDILKQPIPTSYILLMLAWLMSPLTVISAELEPYNGDGELNFSLPDLTGKIHTIPDHQGKVVLVNFWASWCPPCIYEMPELTRLKNKLADKPFEILAINAGEKKYRVRKFTKVVNFNLPVLLDTRKETFHNWGVKTLPTSFLVDADGNIRYRIRGNPGWEDKPTVSVIEGLISEASKTASANKTTNQETSQ